MTGLADLGLDVPLLVTKIGVRERVGEAVVVAEEPEELARADDRAEAPAHLGGFVEGSLRGTPPWMRKRPSGPRRRTPRSRPRRPARFPRWNAGSSPRVLSAGDGAPHPEAGLPEARLALAGRPLELEGPHILR